MEHPTARKMNALLVQLLVLIVSSISYRIVKCSENHIGGSATHPANYKLSDVIDGIAESPFNSTTLGYHRRMKRCSRLLKSFQSHNDDELFTRASPLGVRSSVEHSRQPIFEHGYHPHRLSIRYPYRKTGRTPNTVTEKLYSPSTAISTHDFNEYQRTSASTFPGLTPVLVSEQTEIEGIESFKNGQPQSTTILQDELRMDTTNMGTGPRKYHKVRNKIELNELHNNKTTFQPMITSLFSQLTDDASGSPSFVVDRKGNITTNLPNAAQIIRPTQTVPDGFQKLLNSSASLDTHHSMAKFFNSYSFSDQEPNALHGAIYEPTRIDLLQIDPAYSTHMFSNSASPSMESSHEFILTSSEFDQSPNLEPNPGLDETPAKVTATPYILYQSAASIDSNPESSATVISTIQSEPMEIIEFHDDTESDKQIIEVIDDSPEFVEFDQPNPNQQSIVDEVPAPFDSSPYQTTQQPFPYQSLSYYKKLEQEPVQDENLQLSHLSVLETERAAVTSSPVNSDEGSRWKGIDIFNTSKMQNFESSGKITSTEIIAEDFEQKFLNVLATFITTEQPPTSKPTPAPENKHAIKHFVLPLLNATDENVGNSRDLDYLGMQTSSVELYSDIEARTIASALTEGFSQNHRLSTETSSTNTSNPSNNLSEKDLKIPPLISVDDDYQSKHKQKRKLSHQYIEANVPMNPNDDNWRISNNGSELQQISSASILDNSMAFAHTNTNLSWSVNPNRHNYFSTSSQNGTNLITNQKEVITNRATTHSNTSKPYQRIFIIEAGDPKRIKSTLSSLGKRNNDRVIYTKNSEELSSQARSQHLDNGARSSHIPQEELIHQQFRFVDDRTLNNFLKVYRHYEPNRKVSAAPLSRSTIGRFESINYKENPLVRTLSELFRLKSTIPRALIENTNRVTKFLNNQT